MKCQVLLCGTKYGQTYLPALFQSSDFELAAILANGSDRSVQLAEQAGVSLYSTVEHIDESIDLACVAIGGQVGVDIANALLVKGIPVLIEHPQAAEPMQSLLNCAVRQHSHCQINSHFAELQPIADFIKLAEKLNSHYQAHMISIACNSRTLFSMLDILMRGFGDIALNTISIQNITADRAYRQCSFLVNGTPCQLLYQAWRGENDDSKDSALGHQITVTYPQGVLSLAGTFGPCLWFPLLAGGIPASTPIYSTPHQNQPYSATLQDMLNWRYQANQHSLRVLYKTAFENTLAPPHQNHGYLVQLCLNWDRLFSELGTITVSPKVVRIDKAIFTADSIYQNL